MDSNYRNIGKIVAVFGLQGEVVLQHRLGEEDESERSQGDLS